MIHHVVQFALRQRLLILLLVVSIAIGGVISYQHMPVDAYPDLSPADGGDHHTVARACGRRDRTSRYGSD